MTTLNYLGESRLLPRIYIINTKNEIIWDGEVTDLASILKKIYKGTYNSKVQGKVSTLQQELEVSLRSGNVKETIKISAQTYLRKFYESHDFKQVGEGYLEDGIPHIAMIKY